MSTSITISDQLKKELQNYKEENNMGNWDSYLETLLNRTRQYSFEKNSMDKKQVELSNLMQDLKSKLKELNVELSKDLEVAKRDQIIKEQKEEIDILRKLNNLRNKDTI